MGIGSGVPSTSSSSQAPLDKTFTILRGPSQVGSNTPLKISRVFLRMRSPFLNWRTLTFESTSLISACKSCFGHYS